MGWGAGNREQGADEIRVNPCKSVVNKIKDKSKKIKVLRTQGCRTLTIARLITYDY
jgi:ABC-type lipoprotein release transport system permease subunit